MFSESFQDKCSWLTHKDNWGVSFWAWADLDGSPRGSRQQIVVTVALRVTQLWKKLFLIIRSINRALILALLVIPGIDDGTDLFTWECLLDVFLCCNEFPIQLEFEVSAFTIDFDTLFFIGALVILVILEFLIEDSNSVKSVDTQVNGDHARSHAIDPIVTKNIEIFAEL